MEERFNQKVQKAGIGDLPLIVEIENKLFTEEEGRFEEKAYRWLLENPRDVRAYLSPEEIEDYDIDPDEEIIDASVLLYCVHDIVVGHGTIIVSKDADGKTMGRIYSIGILKEYRRNLFAALFMGKMEQLLWMAGCEYVALETHASYTWWVDHLKTRKYRIMEIVKDYYTEGEDALKMRKELYG